MNRSLGIKLPRGGWLKNLFEDLSFRRRGSQKRFVNRFKSIADYEVVEERNRLLLWTRVEG